MKLRRGAAAVGLLAATALLGIGDYVTGVELTFTLLYLFPIAAGTWLVGLRLGVVLACASAACELVEYYAQTLDPHLLTAIWNNGGAFVIYLVVTFLIAKLRSFIEAERRGRRVAIEQLRHAERLHVIGTLAAGVAHEIGTPLNVISGSAELLVDARSKEEIEDLSKAIREQSARIGDIVRHLLDFGRRGGGGRATVDLNDAARSTVELLSSTARKRSTKIVLEQAEAPVAVLANRSEIEQVLSNLILNALQAMGEGGEVHVKVASEGDLGTVAVEDNGGGISASDLPRIFDPFFTTKGVGEGTGLGLSVSYGIVQDHGGFIGVDSSAGRGSRFTVKLPAQS